MNFDKWNYVNTIYFFVISISLSDSSKRIPLLQSLRFDILTLWLSLRPSILIQGAPDDNIIAGSSGFSEYNSKSGVLILRINTE